MAQTDNSNEVAEENGISLDIYSLEKDFKNLKIAPIIINDVADEFSVGKTIDVINDLIRVSYDSDKLNTVPSCEKGCTTGAFNYDPVNPIKCQVCNTEVKSIINQPLVPQVWMRVPKRVNAFIHPRIYQLFSTYFKHTHFDLIEYLTNPTYVVNKPNNYRGGRVEIERLITFLSENKISRGLNYFQNNFDRIIDLLFIQNPKLFTYKYTTVAAAIYTCKRFAQFIELYRDCVFTRYLPFPSKLIMVSERGGTAEFIDPNMKDAFDAPKTIASLETRSTKPSFKVVQAETVKVIKSMGAYFSHYYSKTCSGKTGMFRGQLGSTRGFYTGRAVIAPLAMEHAYDEIHTPWAWSVTIFSVHIASKLLRMGHNPKEIGRIIDRGTVKWCPVISGILKEIISECPEGGYPVSMLRNPTLRRGSNQYFRITKVHDDIHNNAIMLSVLAIKDPNADFDGDMLQVRLPIDNVEKRQFERWASHLNIMDVDRPNAVAGHITFHPEITTMVNNYLTHHSI